MTKRYLVFLLVVLALMSLDALIVYLVVHTSRAVDNPVFILILSVVFFLCIPFNMFVAWKLVMRNGGPK